MTSRTNEKTYIEEHIIIIRPTSSNHVFNEEKYTKIETYDVDGIKTVLLREKEN
jgi:hypothetical protein